MPLTMQVVVQHGSACNRLLSWARHATSVIMEQGNPRLFLAFDF